MGLINKEYFIVFDTNVLFRNYDKKADFTTFSFNSTFKNVIDMINQLDIYEQVAVLIPEVTWNEMKKQIIDAHADKIEAFKSYVKKWIFPEYSIDEIKVDNYHSFIDEKKNYIKRKYKLGSTKLSLSPFQVMGVLRELFNVLLIKLHLLEERRKILIKVLKMFLYGKAY